MPGIGFYLIPSNGVGERSLSAREAKSQIETPDVDYETRLYGLLEQRKIEGKILKTQNGILFHGQDRDVLTVGLLVSKMPAMMNSSKQESSVPSRAANDDERLHIVSAFDGASRRFNVKPLRFAFAPVAHDATVTYQRGRRPSINGSHMALAA